MKAFEFDQTSIPSNFTANLKDDYGILWVDSRTADFFRAMFASIADSLKIHQSKDKPRIGFTVKDDKGYFKMGAILNYQAPEEGAEEDTGNWYLELTLNQEDMTNLDVEVDNHSDVFIRCSAIEYQSICYGRFRSTEVMYNMINCAIDTLVTFLDVNASDADEVEVTLRGIFTASVGMENGEKVMSLVPGEYIKQIIKNDSAL